MRIFLLVLFVLLVSCTDWDLPKDYPDSVTLSVHTVTDSTVTLLWSKASDTHFGNYVLYKGDGEVIDTSDEVLDTIVFSVDTVYTVQGLTAGTDYSFRVMVNSPEGTYTISNVVKAKTAVDLNSVQLKLQQPDSSNITESSVLLHWGFDKWEWSDTLTTYKLFMDTTNSVDSLDSLVATTVTTTSALVESLEADKKYFFRVYLEHEDTAKAGSNIIEVTTKDGFPTPVTIVDVDTVGDSWATVRFTQSVDSDFAYYCVWQGESKPVDSLKSLDSSSSFATVAPLITDTVVTISNLKSETEYHFAVYVVDSDGNIAPSNTVSITTKDSLYEQFSLTKTAQTANSVSLLFDAYKGNDFVRYEVRGSTSSHNITIQSPLLYSSASVVDTMPIISPLVEGVQYYFKVFVITSGSVKSSNTLYNYPVVCKTPVVVDSVIHLSWSTLYSEPDFSAYKLYRATTPTGPEILVKRFDTMSQTEYSDTATAGTYYYKVYRVLSSGSTDGEASNQVVAIVE